MKHKKDKIPKVVLRLVKRGAYALPKKSVRQSALNMIVCGTRPRNRGILKGTLPECSSYSSAGACVNPAASVLAVG